MFLQTICLMLISFFGLESSLNGAVSLYKEKFEVKKNVLSLSSQFIPSPTPFVISSPTPAPTQLSAPMPNPTKKPHKVSPKPTSVTTPKTSDVIANTQLKISTSSWNIQSVSSMKETKDRVCNQRNGDFIKKWIAKAVGLGANYVSIETPYDSPGCGNAVAYTKLWADEARKQGLRVWHRHMPLSFEGIYNTPKTAGKDNIGQIRDYIKSNKDLFRSGDIFTPIPEPQNGGIKGVTYCAADICQFSGPADFNKFLREAMEVSKQAFNEIGLQNKIKVGYYGFDGFVAWGDNNPDWEGILEDETVKQMGNITIDHYPEAVKDTMENDLNELEKKYPNVPIIIGEWGTTQGGDLVGAVQSSMKAAQRSSVVGFNYWHMGVGGNEALINEDFSERPQFSAVKSFFKP